MKYLLIYILLVIVIFFIRRVYRYFNLAYKLNKIDDSVDYLNLKFKIYNIRKDIVKKENLNYDTVFKYVYDENEDYIKTFASQRQCIKSMYKSIDEIDRYIEKIHSLGVTEEDYNELEIDESICTFYDLRRKIRTERLIYENCV